MKRINFVLFLLVCMILLLGMAGKPGPWGVQTKKGITMADHMPHPQDSMYYMEQWSGTVKFGPKHDLNFNLVHSNLTTKSDKAVFRVEYNTPDGKTLQDSERCTIKSKLNPFMLACGANLITGDANSYKIRFKSSKISVAMKLTPTAPPFRPGTGRLRSSGDSSEFYDFVLMVPRGQALVKIGDKVLKGPGSIDHSYANAGLQEVARHWIRSTYHDEDTSIIFAVNIGNDGAKSGWFSVADNKGAFASANLDVQLANFYNDPDKSGYTAPGSIELKGPDGFIARMPNMKLYSKRDMLDDLSTVERFVVRRFSDPMRYAFKAKAVIDWPKAGKIQHTEKDIDVITKQMND